MTRELLVDPHMITRAVVDAIADGWPLGAYADRDAVRYLVLSRQGQVRRIRVERSGAEITAVSATVPAFSWDEREMAQEWGVRFDGMPDSRPLRARDGAMPDAFVAHGGGVTRVVVGPVHAGIIETGRFTISSGGESIVHLDAQLGFSHRGIERRAVGRDPFAFAPVVARICGACSASRSLAYAHALEQIAGCEVPESAALARLVLAELERISNHVFDLAVASAGAGWAPGQVNGQRLKERALRLCARAAGHRLLFDAIVPGGVRDGVLDERSALLEEIDAFEQSVAEYVRMLFDASSLISRWRGSGLLSFDEAHMLGAVGPAQRASGGTLDVRAVAPYGAYRRLPIVPVRAEEGDVLARCRMKTEELRVSFTLVRDALRILGDRALSRVTLALPPDGEATTVVEGPRGAETVVLALDAERIARFHVISASYRTWPSVVHASATGLVPDFPLINKSFNLCYACVDR